MDAARSCGSPAATSLGLVLLTGRTEVSGTLALPDGPDGRRTDPAGLRFTTIHHGFQLKVTVFPVGTGKVPQRASPLGHRARQHIGNGFVQSQNPWTTQLGCAHCGPDARKKQG